MRNLILLFTLISFNCLLEAETTVEQVQKIIPEGNPLGTGFGNSISVSGKYAIIGAEYETYYEEEGNALLRAGSAYIFEFDEKSNTWSQFQKLTSNNNQSNALFGSSVSIFDNFAIIGARRESFDDNNSESGRWTGSAFIYKLDELSGTWKEIQKIVASDKNGGDEFGISVSISENYAIVGACKDDKEDDNGNILKRTGSAYIYKLDEVSGTWTEVQKILPNDIDEGEEFGYSVAISNNYAIIGTPKEGTGRHGSAYMYKLEKPSQSWIQAQKISASDETQNIFFGNSVAITDNYAIVGAYLNGYDEFGENFEIAAGAAYIFELNKIDGLWVEKQKIVASDRSEMKRFGSSVAIFGSIAFVGAENDIQLTKDGEIESNTGSGYVFEYNKTTNVWTEIKKLVPKEKENVALFGTSIALSKNTSFIGSSGSAYIYKINEITSVESEEIKENLNINIYPNPTNNKTTISSNLNGNYKLYLVDQLGEKVLDIYSGYIKSNRKFELDLDKLSSGNYFVVAESNGKVHSKKLLIID